MALMDSYSGPWTADEAAHLARRAGFGATPAQVASLVAMGMSAAVDSFVDFAATDAALDAQIAALPASTENDRIKNPLGASQLEGWWIYRMVHSTQQLQQQFALFLHDHFASEYSKVSGGVTTSSNYGNDGSQTGQTCTLVSGGLAPDATRQSQITTRLMRDQNTLFQSIGAGAFRDTLRAVTRDPAMLIYLDNRLNVKGKAQENYAREIMELFSMGVGNYTEEDVREVARAFTGETLNASCSANWPYTHTFNTSNHDTNAKTVFGNTFNFAAAGADTNHVIDLILSRISGSAISPAHATHPTSALHMAWKFINWFVSETVPISHAAVVELADFLYNNTTPNGYRYDIRETLRKLLKSQFFYDPAYRYNMFKHPADFLVMALRVLGLQETSYTSTARSTLSNAGMRLFAPPNVAGWNHGEAWINSGNLIARFNYANRLSTSTLMPDAYVDALIPTHAANTNDNAGILEFFRARLLQTSLQPTETSIFNTFYSAIQGTTTTATQSQFRRKVRGTVHLMMSMPRYQLK